MSVEPEYVLSAKAVRHVEIGCRLPPGHDEPCEGDEHQDGSENCRCACYKRGFADA